MKRWLLAACLIAALAVQPVIAAGIAAGFQGVNNATNHAVSITSTASISNLPTGTVWMWVSASSTANALRNIVGKTGAGRGGFEVFKRGVDGTALIFSHARTAGNPLQVTSPTGVLKVNVPKFILFRWDESSSSNCKMFAGELNVPAVDAGATITPGSGTPASDAAQSLVIGANAVLASGWPGVVWTFGISAKTDYTLSEIRRLQFAPTPANFRGCLGLWIFNELPVKNKCGGSNSGTLTGTGRLSPDALPRVMWREPGL